MDSLSTPILFAVLIVVLGGVHPSGGKGNIAGVVLSVLLMQMITNAFTLLRLSQDVKDLGSGILLILTLAAVMLSERHGKIRK